METKIPTYIINLPTSKVRREYMADLLRPYDFLDVNFIEAIDGRKLSEEELATVFDRKRSIHAYGRELNRGEIGCTLSHIKAYRTLLESSHPYALILEDDINFMHPLTDLLQTEFHSLLNTDMPRILFLSGDYWYWFNSAMPRVFDAVGSYAYLINRAAAQLALRQPRAHATADDWRILCNRGVKLYAVHPYLIDANCDMDLLGSDVSQDSWSRNRWKMSPWEVLRALPIGLVKRVLKATGHFEAKTRIIHNQIVS